MPFVPGETPEGAIPFEKGKSGNPKGRKKGVPNRATVFKRWMKTRISVSNPRDPKGEPLKVTLLEAAALGQIQSAMRGNTAAFKEIQDTLYGKMPDKTELTGPNGGPIELTTPEQIKQHQLNEAKLSWSEMEAEYEHLPREHRLRIFCKQFDVTPHDIGIEDLGEDVM